MAPYVGLFGRSGFEIGSQGYRRKDLSQVNFKISPPDGDDHDAIMLNVSEVHWRAKEDWPDVLGISLYREVDDVEPFVRVRFPEPKTDIEAGDTLLLHKGAITYRCSIYSVLKFEPQEETK